MGKSNSKHTKKEFSSLEPTHNQNNDAKAHKYLSSLHILDPET